MVEVVVLFHVVMFITKFVYRHGWKTNSINKTLINEFNKFIQNEAYIRTKQEIAINRLKKIQLSSNVSRIRKICKNTCFRSWFCRVVDYMGDDSSIVQSTSILWKITKSFN